MPLLCYITPYSLIAVLDGDKIARVKFPYPVFIDNYSDVWRYVYNEALSQLGLKEPPETLVVCNSEDGWYSRIKGKSLKVISAQSAFSKFNIPLVYLGEKRFYYPGGVLEFNINPGKIFKWFDFEEADANVENFFQNRFLYGPSFVENVWEKTFHNALLREKMQFAFKNIPPEFFETVGELYLSGESLYNYDNLQELLLTFLDSMAVSGFWRMYFDEKSVLGPLAGLYSQKKGVALEFLNEYKFKHIADVFVVPSVPSAQVIFSDGKKQVLNLKQEGIHLIPSMGEEELTVNIKLKKGDFEKKIVKSVFGVVFDTRKRPLAFSDSRTERLTMRDNLRKQVRGWEG
ncbi:MAG: hypothetical protein ABIJ36_00195 [Patescibacteria group bacterium]|nr:hypothetical protein [Patescibacteria group bacterium]